MHKDLAELQTPNIRIPKTVRLVRARGTILNNATEEVNSNFEGPQRHSAMARV
jgi:hypothetical protein